MLVLIFKLSRDFCEILQTIIFDDCSQRDKPIDLNRLQTLIHELHYMSNDPIFSQGCRRTSKYFLLNLCLSS